MTHWFHRNPLKATAPQDFDVRKVAMKSDFSKIMGDLRQARRTLLATFTDPSASTETMEKASGAYFSLLLGLINAPSPKSAETPKKENASESQSDDKTDSDKSETPSEEVDQKLKTFFRFKWSQSLWISRPPVVQEDAEYELVNMGVNVGIWYTKHAARISDKQDINMDDAKEVLRSLKIAAGIFKEFKDNRVGRLLVEGDKTSDLDPRILDCYITCCQAEAQEVTLARAVEMKHSHHLISSLSNDTASFFQRADGHLKALDQEVVLKWRKYLQLKQAFYKAYAYCYHGETLLGKEKCGDAIKCLTESEALSEKCFSLCKEYMSTKGAGSTVRPHEHNFYQRLQRQIRFTLDKLKRENSFIYFQKVPEVVPDMDLKATYGLVEPEVYSVPDLNPSWTSTIYTGFNVSKNVENNKKGKKPQKDVDVVPVKEPDIKVTRGSDCTIS
uniref:BRO1 domain-containing protein BROX-like n=1 Tax=Styela clava TaxID=7725 RepID=UPI0019398C81|nr:BRO1 domain-containing protein BROX-like [Styela clava]